MNFTMKQSSDGSMLVRQLSEKAQRYYYETDPCGVFVTTLKIYVNDCGTIHEFDTKEEVEQFFEEMVDEYFDSCEDE